MSTVKQLDYLIQETQLDSRFALNLVRRAPLATCVIVGSIALGVGMTTAIVTLADAMLFRPLPYPFAERLVVPFQIVRVPSRARTDTISWSFGQYEVLRHALPDFAASGFATPFVATVRIANEDRSVRIEALAGPMARVFGIAPQAGSGFRPEDDAGDNPTTVALMSDDLWRHAYGGNYRALGSTIEINGARVRVVGIMRAGFAGFTTRADLWMPLRMIPRIDPAARSAERLATQRGFVIAKMAPGMTLVSARREVTAAFPIVKQIATNRFEASDGLLGVGVMSLEEARRHPLVEPMLQLLGAAVTGLLLIVCANVASILLARGQSRESELGVRLALGASRGRIGRQVITESLMLGAIAFPFAVILGYNGAALLALMRPSLPPSFVLLRGTDMLTELTLAPNARVLLFALTITLGASLTFGIAPTLAAMRVDPRSLLASAAAGSVRRSARGRRGLVLGQIAAATALLVGAMLMVRSLSALLRTNVGFDTERVAVFHLRSRNADAGTALRRQALLSQMTSSKQAGLTAASAGCPPFSTDCAIFMLGVKAADGSDGAARPVQVESYFVSAMYFETMGIPLLFGQLFVPGDSVGGTPRVLLSETAARQIFGTSNVVDRRVVLAGGNQAYDVAGVVADVRFRSVESPPGAALYWLARNGAGASPYEGYVLARSHGSADQTIARVRDVIRTSDSGLSILDAQPLSQLVRRETSTTRFLTVLLLSFAAAAVVLAGLGVYGVVAYVVSQQRREFSVRLVLGANASNLRAQVIKDSGVLVIPGLILGLLGAGIASRLVAFRLYGVTSLDPATYAGAALLVAIISLLAAVIPANRVAQIDPAESLRSF